MKTLDEILFELISDYLPPEQALELSVMLSAEIKSYFKYFFVAGMGAGAGLLVLILKWIH